MRPKLSISELNQLFVDFAADPKWADFDVQVNKDTATYNRSIAHMGLKHAQLTKDKISAALKGRPVVIVACPHCGKTGGHAAMCRWHFDACKFNPDVR
jgi:hypothetical protein